MTLLRLILLGRVWFGTATTFSSHDVWNPNHRLACISRDLNDERDVAIAHPTLPCGSKVIVCLLRNGRCAAARVLDRGPRRALLDLTPALAKKLKFNGMEPAMLVKP